MFLKKKQKKQTTSTLQPQFIHSQFMTISFPQLSAVKIEHYFLFMLSLKFIFCFIFCFFFCVQFAFFEYVCYFLVCFFLCIFSFLLFVFAYFFIVSFFVLYLIFVFCFYWMLFVLLFLFVFIAFLFCVFVSFIVFFLLCCFCLQLFFVYRALLLLCFKALLTFTEPGQTRPCQNSPARLTLSNTVTAHPQTVFSAALIRREN